MSSPTSHPWGAVRTIEGHSSGVLSVALSLDGVHIVSGSGEGDHTIKVWDLASGACVRTLVGHSSNVWSLAVVGAHIVSGGQGPKTGPNLAKAVV